VELRGGDVVLAKGSWGCGEARVVLPTVRPKAALVGGETPVEIGGQWLVNEH
jgi:hypothetical protein